MAPIALVVPVVPVVPVHSTRDSQNYNAVDPLGTPNVR